MTIYTCLPDLEAMLSCIYAAWASKKGHAAVRLQVEPITQYTLFDEYIHVDADAGKARSVIDAINRKLSPYVYQELAYTAMAYEEDTLDTLYHVLILGFALGPNVLQMSQYKDVMRFQEIRKRVGSEAHHFREFLRFHEIQGSVYVAHFEPKSRIVSALAPMFADRMPSEHWMIVDDVHLEAVIHPKDESCYFRKLSHIELSQLLETERANDRYTDLWEAFFHSIAIKERTNERCQRNLFPLWARKHAVEFRNEETNINPQCPSA